MAGNEGPQTEEAQVQGVPTTAGQTVMSTLERMETFLGTGASPPSASGTHTVASIDTTYRQIAEGAVAMRKLTPTTDGKIAGRIFLTNMASGDNVCIQVQTQQVDGTFKAKNTYTYNGAQPATALTLDIEEYYYNGFGVQVMIYQDAGTAKTFPFITQVD